MSDQPPTPPPPDLMPLPPLSELAAGAVQLHEAYQTYVYAGFSEDQAFKLITLILHAGMRGPR